MGIRPWEHALLTHEQFEAACADIDQYIREQEKGGD